VTTAQECKSLGASSGIELISVHVIPRGRPALIYPILALFFLIPKSINVRENMRAQKFSRIAVWCTGEALYLAFAISAMQEYYYIRAHLSTNVLYPEVSI
jgi:hypothetical protein